VEYQRERERDQDLQGSNRGKDEEIDRRDEGRARASRGMVVIEGRVWRSVRATERENMLY